jgi:hypothetical protein
MHPKLKKSLVAGSAVGCIAAVLAFGACVWVSLFGEEPVTWAFSPWWQASNWFTASVTFILVAVLVAGFAAIRPERSRIRTILVWLVRAVYLSVILAICDCWTASRPHKAIMFSRRTWTIADGGTAGYVGFGYSLTYYRRLDVSLDGPVIWFWFTPFKVSFARRNPGLLWVW